MRCRRPGTVGESEEGSDGTIDDSPATLFSWAVHCNVQCQRQPDTSCTSIVSLDEQVAAWWSSYRWIANSQVKDAFWKKLWSKRKQRSLKDNAQEFPSQHFCLKSSSFSILLISVWRCFLVRYRSLGRHIHSLAFTFRCSRVMFNVYLSFPFLFTAP